MYIFDADSLIHAYRDDFPPKQGHTDFWDWFDSIGNQEGIRIPEKVIEEFDRKTDGLTKFIKALPHLSIEPTANCTSALPKVLSQYGPLTDVDLEIMDKKGDPYVISSASLLLATVVSGERSQPEKIGHNRKIPDICASMEPKVAFESYAHFLWRMRGLYTP